MLASLAAVVGLTRLRWPGRLRSWPDVYVGRAIIPLQQADNTIHGPVTNASGVIRHYPSRPIVFVGFDLSRFGKWTLLRGPGA